MPLFPLITTLLLGGLTAWLWLTDNVMRSLSVMLVPVLWFVLNGLWWALHRRGVRLRRLGLFVLVSTGIWAFFKFAVRFEGSADGSAWPQLSFVWQKKDEPGLKTLPQAQSASVLAAAPAGARDMPRFLGEKGDGVLPEAEFATDWAAKPPREVWRVEIGAGWGGFAVVGNRALTQEQRGEMECVTCYELSSGKLLWSHTDKARFEEIMGGIGPRATPTVDAAAGVVFTLGATGILNCLDLATGAKKWSAQVLKDAGASKNLEWAKSASPLLTAAHVICSGGEDGAGLVAYDRASGQVAWKAGTDGGSYVSPVVLKLNGREQIVTVNRQSVTGHDLTTGVVIWTYDWPGVFPKVGQPIALNDHELFVTASYGMKCHRIDLTGGKPRTVWAESSPRTKFSSASVFGTHAYAIDEGTLCCVNLENGERGWREGRFGFGQQIRVGNDLLLIQTEKGPLVLLRPDPAKLIEIGRIDALKTKTWNPPTLAGRWLLLRNDREAVCYELPAK